MFTTERLRRVRLTTGFSASSGKVVMASTRDFTSSINSRMSRSASTSMETVPWFSLAEEVSRSTPSRS